MATYPTEPVIRLCTWEANPHSTMSIQNTEPFKDQLIEEWIDNYYDYLCILAIKFYKSARAIEEKDLVQAVFCKISGMELSALQNIHNPKAYLRTSLLHAFLMEKRKGNQFDKFVDFSLSRNSICHDENGIFSTIDSKIIKEVAKAILQELHYDILLLFLNGYKYKEISEEMDISINTVGVIIKRSKEKVQDYFGK